MLALLKLGDTSWVSSAVDMPLPHREALQSAAVDPTAPPRVLKHAVRDALAMVQKARSKAFLPDIHANSIPAYSRHAVRDLHPCIVQPNRCLEGTVGYTTQVRPSPCCSAELCALHSRLQMCVAGLGGRGGISLVSSSSHEIVCNPSAAKT